MGLRSEIRKLLGLKKAFYPDEISDDVGVRYRNLSSSLHDPLFKAAWGEAKIGNKEAWRGKVPDVRYRAYTALWAAKHGLSLPGDFVECGVFTGLLSMTICHALDFARVDKTFYLFDTYNGVPEGGLTGDELADAKQHNARLYFDCFEIAKRNFSPWPNAKLIRGILPGTLVEAPIERIAYLSIDLNSAAAEKSVIAELWDRLTPSAIVILDDYGFGGYAPQHAMWNEFARSKGGAIYSSPTGQGILVKPS